MAVRNHTEKTEVSAKEMGRAGDVGGGAILREEGQEGSLINKKLKEMRA